MVPNGKVVSLRPDGLSGAEMVLRQLVEEAGDALAAVRDGDVDSVFRLHRLVNRAVAHVMDNRMATPRCPTCGAEVSGGRCWGCGRPPSGRAS